MTKKDSKAPPGSPSKTEKVDKVAVATKHPGVFMQTSELEAETGKTLQPGIEIKEVRTPLAGKIRSALSDDETEVPKKMTRRQKSEEEKKKEHQEESDPKVEVKDEVMDVGEPLPVEDGQDAAEIEISQGTEGDKESESISAVIGKRRSKRKIEVEAKEKNKETENPNDDLTNIVEVGGKPHPDGELSEADSESSELRDNDDESVDSGSTLTTRSSLRKRGKDSTVRSGSSVKGKSKGTKGNRGTNIKGKSRRSIFKKSSTKAPTAVARIVTSDRVYYKGEFYTRGDIVSLIDIDGGVYYAQLRGFLTDQYCEKSGVITWLLPTTNSPKPEEGFDASTYIIGTEEELPRKLDCMTFVMHAPDDYFHYKNAPYPTLTHSSDQEYLVTRGIPKVRLIKDGKINFKDKL